MRQIVFLILAIMALPNLCFAESLLHLQLTFYPNDSLVLDEMSLSEGIPTRFLVPGEYKMDILNQAEEKLYERNFSVGFFILTDPPTLTNESEVLLKVPYNPNMRRLEVYKGEKLLFSSEINLCNRDGLCQTENENYLSCPKDCPLEKTDEFCIKEEDGTCDPDCLEGVDPDCKENSNTGVYLVFVFLTAVIIVLFSLYRRRQNEVISKS